MTSSPPHKPQRVFVVDDEPSLRNLFSVALDDPSREVQTCEDGVTALKTLRDETFHLILLDLSLPDTDGIHILREMRERGDETPVILCSANVDERSFHDALKFGVTAFIDKPVTLLELRKIVSDVLAGEMGNVGSPEKFAQKLGFRLDPSQIDPYRKIAD